MSFAAVRGDVLEHCVSDRRLDPSTTGHVFAIRRRTRSRVELMPQFAEYAEKTTRTIPVIVLTPSGG
jgi:hypothetical protein